MTVGQAEVQNGLDGKVPIAISARGPATQDTTVRFGFWLFILSDIIIFAALFAAYAVLSHKTAGGPAGPAIFHRSRTIMETGCLLGSTFTCGMMAFSVERRRQASIFIWGAATFLLGAAFISLELWEFSGLIADGAGPQRSAFLSAFFTLVGTHGLHVAAGLIWLAVMGFQLLTFGLEAMVMRRFFCFTLFWHALDIVWIAIFTIVYLGAGQ